MTGLLTFYIKGEITAEQNFLKIRIPNTVLGFIPLGSTRHNIPVAQISSVATDFQFNIKSFIASLVPLYVSFLCFHNGLDGFAPALLTLAAGLVLMINSFITSLRVDSTAGAVYYIPFLIFEKSKARKAEEMIGQIIASRQDDTNVRQATETQTGAIRDAASTIVDAIKSK